MTKNPTFKAYSEPEILQKAWEVQLTSVPSILKEGLGSIVWCASELEQEGARGKRVRTRGETLKLPNKESTFAHSSSSNQITSTLRNQPRHQNPTQGLDRSDVQKIRTKEATRQLNSFCLTPIESFITHAKSYLCLQK